MQCPQCRQENAPGARFCNACGARLEIVCPACGHGNVSGSRFCSACGQPLAGTGGPSASPGRFASPGAYTPSYLAEKIITLKQSLEGERKQVTVLFADLKGSLELLDRDPEEARKLLDPVLDRMMEAVHFYEGTVNQVMGDGIMALFGAPLAHEDHAVRACYAALRMQDSVKRYAAELQRTAGIPLHIRVGLNSGEVVVRSISSDLNMDYTAVGQTTHLAARMEQLAMPGTILITGDVLHLAEGYVQITPLGPVSVKGLPEPLAVHELTGATAVRARFQPAVKRGLTRFVGRADELEALQHALERTRRGQGQVVAVVGEPGVGKSRLFWEFTRSHRTQGCLVLESSSFSHGKATAYLPVIDLLKAYFQIEARDDGRRIREKVTGKVLTLDRTLESILPPFLTLLEAPADDEQWQGLDVSSRRQRTQDALRRLVLRESQVQPLVLVFEDLHWIDSETQALLDGLVERLPTSNILLLVNYRPEYQHGWGNKVSYAQIRLDPLPQESAEELLQALLGSDPGLAQLKRLLIERTEGNPFYVEESVRTLVETQTLAGDPGAYRLTKPLPAVQVPLTVQAVLAARIDRLTPEQKTLLQAAAVVGRDVPFSLLRAITDIPEQAVRTTLAQLQAAEFLFETSLFPDLEYSFKHALTQEVTYGGLLHDRRRTLHARIVEAMETLYAERVSDDIERLADHAFRAELWENAVGYLSQAGGKARARSANREAVTLYDRALEALSHLPEKPETTRQTVELRIRLVGPLMALGDPQRMLDNVQRAEPLARAMDDERALAEIYGHLAYIYGSMGAPDRALEPAQRALDLSPRTDPISMAGAYNMLARANYALGRYSEAIEYGRAGVEALSGDLVYEGVGSNFSRALALRTWIVLSSAELGAFGDGLGWGREVREIADTARRPHELVWGYYGVGRLHVVRGDPEQAIPLLEHVFPLCETGELPVYLPRVASALGAAYSLLGRTGDAIAILEEGVRRGEAIHFMFGHSLAVTLLAEAYLQAGRYAEALREAARALELARSQKERGFEAYALRALGEVSAQHDRSERDQAEGYYRHALELAEALQMRPLAARCRLGLGILHRQMGAGKSEEEFGAAREQFRSLDMAFWERLAEQELSSTGSSLD